MLMQEVLKNLHVTHSSMYNILAFRILGMIVAENLVNMLIQIKCDPSFKRVTAFVLAYIKL